MKVVRRLVIGTLALLAMGVLPRWAAAEDYECITVTTTSQRITTYSDGSVRIITSIVTRTTCTPI